MNTLYHEGGNCPFRQHMSNKPGKYGIEMWVASRKNQGMQVVLKMSEGLQGYNGHMWQLLYIHSPWRWTSEEKTDYVGKSQKK